VEPLWSRERRAIDARESDFAGLDNARLADTDHQILSLSHFERFALWQLLLKHEMTAEQFRDLARHEHGLPATANSPRR
jgi:hypothetical protein